MKRWGGKRQQAVFENGVRKAASTDDAARSHLTRRWQSA